jgi:hypothetical protein
VLARGKPFKPSLMFIGKARGYSAQWQTVIMLSVTSEPFNAEYHYAECLGTSIRTLEVDNDVYTS